MYRGKPWLETKPQCTPRRPPAISTRRSTHVAESRQRLCEHKRHKERHERNDGMRDQQRVQQEHPPAPLGYPRIGLRREGVDLFIDRQVKIEELEAMRGNGYGRKQGHEQRVLAQVVASQVALRADPPCNVIPDFFHYLKLTLEQPAGSPLGSNLIPRDLSNDRNDWNFSLKPDTEYLEPALSAACKPTFDGPTASSAKKPIRQSSFRGGDYPIRQHCVNLRLIWVGLSWSAAVATENHGEQFAAWSGTTGDKDCQ
jgi:hypothetical protein